MNVAIPNPPTLSKSNWTSILDARSKELPSTQYSYKLAGSHYGLDWNAIEQPVIDESKMSMVLPFASGVRRDGVGDLLEIGGIVLERHRANPAILLDHGKNVQLPIGMALEWDTLSQKYDNSKYTVRLDPINKVAEAIIYFYRGIDDGEVSGIAGTSHQKKTYDHAVFCEQLFDMVCKGMLRSGSVGYQIISAQELPPDYSRGTPKGLHLQSVLMLEASLVVMPANQDTCLKVLSMPSCCGKPLSEYLIKSLTPYAPPKIAQMGYEGKSIKASGEFVGDLNWLKEEEQEKEHKTMTTPVPLNENLSKTDIPPVKWKPGEGAEKSQPSDKIPAKQAEEILKAGTAQGHKLTPKQQGMFGAAAEKDKKSLKSLKGKYSRKYLKEVVITPLLARPGFVGLYSAHDNVELPDAPEFVSSLEASKWAVSQGYTVRRKGLKDANKARIKLSDVKDAEKKWQQAVSNSSSPNVDMAVDRAEQKYRDLKQQYESQKSGEKSLNSEVKRYHVTQNPKSMRWFIIDDYGDKRMDAGVFNTKQQAQSAVDELNAKEDKSLTDSNYSIKSVDDVADNGYMSAKLGKKRTDNPYPQGSSEYHRWDNGFMAAKLGQPRPKSLNEYGIKTLIQLSDPVTGTCNGRPVKWSRSMSVWVYDDTPGNAPIEKVPLPISLSGRNPGDPMMASPNYGKALTKNYGKVSAGWPDRIKFEGREYWSTSRKAQGFNNGVISVAYETENRDDQIWVDKNGNIVEKSLYGCKSLGTVENKAMELRKKYRTSKGLRRRLKSSKPGSSVLWVSGSNLKKCKEFAEQKGLEFAHVGSHKSGAAKIKLMGDDNAIDEVAKEYGRSLKAFKSKGINNMPKNLNGKSKAMGEDVATPAAEEVEVTTEEPTEDIEESAENEEKFSMQVLRRMHEDATLLLEQYDEFFGQLEHEEIGATVQAKCEALVEEIEGLEELANKHHPDAKALGGDVGEDESEAEPADSGEPERPTPEEALEGMETKMLRNKYIKSLQKSYGKKSTPEVKVKHVCPECAMEGKESCSCDEEALKKDISDETPGNEVNDEGPRASADMPDTGGEVEKLDEHEKSMAHKAKDFLHEIGNTLDHQFSMEHKMKAFHYHKSLEDMSGGGEEPGDESTGMGESGMASLKGFSEMDKEDEDSEVTEGKAFPEEDKADEEVEVSKGKKDFPQVDKVEEFSDVQEGGPAHACRKCMKDASGFLKSLSDTQEYDFGESHREKAMMHHGALSKALDAVEQMNKEDANTEIQEPGEIGEKELKQMKEKALKDHEEMVKFNNKIIQLRKQLVRT